MAERTVASRVKGGLRRLLGRGGVDPAVQARLDHHDQALRDITAALQAVQAVVPDIGDRVEFERRLDAVEEHLPELLGFWSSNSGSMRRLQRLIDQGTENSERHAQSIGELWDRIEFVRREVMYELRYAGGGNDAAPAPIESRVIDAERVERMAADGLRLNLGCGHIALPEYVNVDMRELPGVDVVAAIDDLPFDDGSVREIHSAHVLEHFAEEELHRRLLPYWWSKLEPGGEFRAIVPDGLSMLEAYGRGEVDFADLKSVLYGGQEYEGDFHFTMFAADTLSDLLERSGFVDVVVEDSGRRNDISLELQVAARRPR
ncbi:MAG: hypothetical protein M3Y51_03540 [Actinomycetota bacterium]|nr:hypothetical protein [Actinomycetota bacterium]